jgi:tRNA pseudouridine55 synthase
VSKAVPAGVVVVDKPPGWTSHDVVAKVRKLAGTRKVGHGGTLDPMATGVLVAGIGKATRLLGHLAAGEKAYTATIRLGQATSTDDAEGEMISAAPRRDLTEAALPGEAVRAAAAKLTGTISQVPPQVSAVQVGGERAYRMAREGRPVELAAREVTVLSFEIHRIRREGPGDGNSPEAVDLDVSVVCSSGTYIRALARDLGDALAVGGHLTALRRTRAGPYTAADARTLDELAAGFSVIPLAAAAAAVFPRRDVSAAEAQRVAHGGPLPATGAAPGTVAVFGPDGAFLALVEETGGQARPVAVFVP